MGDFVHLHVHTDFSLLDATAQIAPLISRVKELGMDALAITDHGNMFGALNFLNEAKEQKIKPIIGCEFYMAGSGSRLERKVSDQGKRNYHLILLAKNQEGYRNLMRLSTLAYTEGFYYDARIDFELLERHSGGLICLTACVAGELPQILLAGQKEKAEDFVMRYKKIFGEENFFIELQDHGIEIQRRVAPLLIALAQKTNTPMVVTNDIHYVMQDYWEAHDILLYIGRQEKMSDKSHEGYGAKEFHVKSPQEMERLFPNYPEMITNTRRIADMCEDYVIPQFETQDLKDCLPVYKIPAGFSNADEYLRHLVDEGLKDRYAQVTEAIRTRANYELDTIISMGFTGYFLIVWDFIFWAKEHDIPVGPGRGSGAGSIVAYALGITNMDPLHYGLIFERFLNPERITMPDFDIDLSDDRRQEVIDYTRQKYGDDQVGHIITFSTLKPKAVVKDVGRVLEIPYDDVNMLREFIPERAEEGEKIHLKDAFEVNPKVQDSGQLAQYKNDPRYTKLFEICLKLEGAHRNASLHASGIVIGKTPLIDWAPLYRETKTGKIATQYTMDMIESCGLVKMDYLGLKTLSVVKRTVDLIKEKTGFENFDIDKISPNDEKSFELFCKGETAAFFQFESAGMQKILRQARPNRIEDLVALNALYRPGPMANIPQFIEGKFNHNKITYPDPCLKDILEETYGVIVYQEQVMQVAQKIAGYTLGQADILRRAMGKKKREILDKEKKPFIEGAVKNGFSREHADTIFEILAPFAGYGFNKSHAAAYSVLAYQTAYLKANFPLEFMAAILTNEIGSTDKLPVYLNEARSMKLTLLPPDINASREYFVVQNEQIVFGLLGIKGLGTAAATEIVNKRNEGGPYKNFLDFLDRVDLRVINKKSLEALIKTGCFDSTGQSRAMLFFNTEKAVEYAESKKQDKAQGQVSLFEGSGEKEFRDFVFTQVDDWQNAQKLMFEKEFIGCYVSAHPLDAHRDLIEKKATLHSVDAAAKAAETDAMPMGDNFNRSTGTQYVAIGSIQGLLEIITKKGAKMARAELEDLYGKIKILFFPKTWEKLSARVHDDAVLALLGTVRSDRSGEQPVFYVDDIPDLNTLKDRQRQELHIRVSEFCPQPEQNFELRDFLFSVSGGGSVFFHINRDGKKFIVKANGGIGAPVTNAFMQELEKNRAVESAWYA